MFTGAAPHLALPRQLAPGFVGGTASASRVYLLGQEIPYCAPHVRHGLASQIVILPRSCPFDCVPLIDVANCDLDASRVPSLIWNVDSSRQLDTVTHDVG